MTEEKKMSVPTVQKERNGFSRLFASKKIWKWGGIAIFVLAFLAWWNLFRERELIISPDTTIITKPLTSDEKQVDSIEWLRNHRPLEMKTDENAARILIRELRPQIETFDDDLSAEEQAQREKEYEESIYRELGLDPQISETAQLGEFYTEYDAMLREKYPAGENEEESPEYLEARDKFDSLTQFERVLIDEDFTRDWVARNNDALDIVVAASKAKIYKYPFVAPGDNHQSIFDIRLPCEREARHYSRSLAVRASWRIAQGDIDGAMDDILACRRLGQKFEENADFLVSQLIGTAMVGVASSLAPGWNPEMEPTRDQWQRFYDEITASPFQSAVSKTLATEQMAGACFIAQLSSSSPQERKQRLNHYINNNATEEESDSFTDWTTFGYDWNTVLREYHRLYNLIEEGEDEWINLFPFAPVDETPPSPLSQTATLLRRCSTLQGRSKFFAQSLAGLLIPSIPSAQEASRRAVCIEQLQRIAIAMRLYACDHDGHLPPTYTVDQEGKPLHSWRVLLLPYLGYESLYQRLRLNEPWDSPYNAQFATENLPIYRCPSMQKIGWLADGDTSYSVIVGSDTLFAAAPTENGIKPSLPTQRATERFLVVERQGGINWMKPDAELTKETALLGLNPSDDSTNPQQNKTSSPNSEAMGGVHPGGMNYACYGGNAGFLSTSADEKVIDSYITVCEPAEEPSSPDSPGSETNE